MSKLRSVIYPCNNETLINSWAATPFTFQWQRVKDHRLGPGLISMSPKKYNKILIYSKKVSQSLPVEECQETKCRKRDWVN